VWIVPCDGHPFGKVMSPFDDRVAMCRAAFARLRGVSRVVTTADRLRSDKTIDLLEFLKAGSHGCDFLPVIGLDEANQICRWHRWEDLLLSYRFVVVERATEVRTARELEMFYWRRSHVYLSPRPPVPHVSSTDARRNIGYLGNAALLSRWGSLDEMYGSELSGIMSRPAFAAAVSRGLYGCPRPCPLR